MRDTSPIDPETKPETRIANGDGVDRYPIGCILMGAGVSKRFQAPDPGAPVLPREPECGRAEEPFNKLVADFNGKPLIRHAADTLSRVGFRSYIAVLREHETERALDGTPFCIVWNRSEDFFSPSVTIRCGIRALPDDLSGALFAVGDQPLITEASIRRLCDAFLEDPTRITVLSFEGTPGNPCIFPKALFAELKDLREGESGKAVVRRHPDLVRTVEAGSLRELFDIDTKEELRIVRERTPGF